MKSFVLASSNKHKIEELNHLFKGVVRIEAPEQKIEVVEDGNSFEENALKKAKAYFDKYKKPSVADDSGLVVNALPEELGIYSARFGGEGLNDKDRYELLLKKLENTEDRSAYFVCVLCFYINDAEIYFFQGKLDGEIAQIPIGEEGFGYDPVFLASKAGGKSLAQDPQWKSLNSHRALAVKEAKSFFEGQ